MGEREVPRSIGFGPIGFLQNALCPSTHQRPAMQFTPPSSSHSWTQTPQMRSMTPRSIHRCIVRCPELSSGNPFGSGFHWQPLRIRKMIASSTPRASTRDRPVLAGGSCFRSTGVIRSHNSSGTRQIVGSGPAARFACAPSLAPFNRECRRQGNGKGRFEVATKPLEDSPEQTRPAGGRRRAACSRCTPRAGGMLSLYSA